MSIIALPNWLTAQPQNAVTINTEFTKGLTWLTCPSVGHGNLAPGRIASSSVPKTRAITSGAGGLGYVYVNGSAGDNPTQSMAAFGATNRVTYFSVVYRTGTAANAGIIFDRGGLWGSTLGSDGASFGYYWSGSDNAYVTGLAPKLNAVSAMAHAISPAKVMFALDGKTNVRTNANATQTFLGTGTWLGTDNLSTIRTFPGRILMAGMVLGDSWSEGKLRSFSQNPWQIFSPPRQKKYWLPFVAAAPNTSRVMYIG